MAFIGFDLDETLGKFRATEFYLMALQPYTNPYDAIWSGKYGTQKFAPPVPLTAPLKEAMDKAFDVFIDCLAEKYKSSDIGLLRSGIIEIARRLQELKTVGLVKSVVVYSNNGSLTQLQLAARLIEKVANAPGLFCNLIHWFHPSRRNEIAWAMPGRADKHLKTLLEAFESGSCKQRDVDVGQVYFFDDASHPDIKNILGERYFQVPRYEFDVNSEFLDDCFKQAFFAAALDTNQEYFQYMSPLLKGKLSFEGVKALIDSMKEPRTLLKPNNTTFLRKFNQTFPKRITRNNFKRALTTMRSLEKKLNVANVVSTNELESLRRSKNILTQYETENPNSMGGKRSQRKTRRRRAH